MGLHVRPAASTGGQPAPQLSNAAMASNPRNPSMSPQVGRPGTCHTNKLWKHSGARRGEAKAHRDKHRAKWLAKCLLNPHAVKVIPLFCTAISYCTYRALKRIVNSRCCAIFNHNTEVHGQTPCSLGPLENDICEWYGLNRFEFNMAAMFFVAIETF